jgi:hypothetical protein
MSRKLVTTLEAMFHLFLDEETPELALKIEAASEAVIAYLGDDATFLSTDEETKGDVVPALVPAQVKAATLIWLAELYQEREGEKGNPVPSIFGYGYPPAAVVSLLAPLRDPRMA